MNEALNTYKDRRDIWSISGYMPNIEIPNDYKDDICMIKRASSWGWGTWKDRWELNDWELNDYYSFKNSKKMIKEFNKSGNDLTYMLEDQIKGRINSWAIRWVYSQFKNNMWTIYPIKSFIENIGNDFSGTHCIATNKYNVELSRSMIKLNKNIKINEQICMSFKSKYDLNIVGYIGVVIKKIGLYRPARKLRNKMFKIIKYKEYK